MYYKYVHLINVKQELTSLYSEIEACFFQAELSVCKMQTEMQNDIEGLSPSNNQTLLSIQICAMAAAVALYVQITALYV